MQLGRLAGLGEILLAVVWGLLLGCDEARVASRTRGGLQPLPPFLFNFIVAMCWFAGLYSFPQAVSGELWGSNRRWEPLAGPQCSV